MLQLFALPHEPDEEFSNEWIGLFKSCTHVPADALSLVDNRHYHDEDRPKDDFGRFERIEWMDQPDWFRHETPTRGWIPLAKEDDTRRGAWAAQTKVLMALGGPDENGRWRLAEQDRELVKSDLEYFRNLMDEVLGSSSLLDEDTIIPELFEVERVDEEFDLQHDVHCMVADARRAVGEIKGFLSWWMAAMGNQWMRGLTGRLIDEVIDLSLPSYDKRGYILSLHRDWRSLNFPLLVKHQIPLYFCLGDLELRDRRFARLEKGLMGRWLAQDERNSISDLWADDLPESLDLSTTDPILRFDRYLQLKIDPRSRYSGPLPKDSEMGGRIEYYVIDFQGWRRRLLSREEDAGFLHEFYHHIVVESRSERVTRVIFHRFHRKPPLEELTSTDQIVLDARDPVDLSLIRERFKARCAPLPGQMFDAETGIERRRAHDKDEPMDIIMRYERETLLTDFSDARSYISIESSRDGTPRRSRSPDHRGRRSYPIRAASPMRFVKPRSRGGELMEDLEERRAAWLNNFADWGRDATYESSLWRMPIGDDWNPEVLEFGYLIIGEIAEFRLRYQTIVNPAVRFPRHILELALERGIQFAIAYKPADWDRFKPKVYEEEYSRFITKAQVDLRAKGPRLSPSTSIRTLYMEYRKNLSLVADAPQARALIFRGGAASWILRAFLGLGLVRKAMRGPSVQVTVHGAGANDSGDFFSIGVSWDDVCDGDYDAIFGYIQGTTPDLDAYLFPTNEILEEMSDHYFGEWNPFCDDVFARLKREYDEGRGRARTKSDWRHYFQSSNRGERRPTVKVDMQYIEDGMARIRGAFQYATWNKRRIRDLAQDVPHVFRTDF
ncbi:hypothetical protein B0H12DRAFT_1018054 [Mycena haematopus]|nr:hypothetical protein B0H12DRAFT_1018054 [Mycena haematopus]